MLTANEDSKEAFVKKVHFIYIFIDLIDRWSPFTLVSMTMLMYDLSSANSVGAMLVEQAKNKKGLMTNFSPRNKENLTL